jgi:two-component sensor histidine kinase
MTEDHAGDEAPQNSLFIRLAFVPTPSLVSGIARLVSDFCKTGLSDLDVTTRFHMAAHELTENIAKYSTTARASLEIELSESAGKRLLTMRTKNRAAPDRLVEVEKRLRELQSAPDPIQLYDRLIEETAPLEGVSGLGLARIRAEGLDFNYQIDGDELTLIVQEPLPDLATREARQHG